MGKIHDTLEFSLDMLVFSKCFSHISEFTQGLVMAGLADMTRPADKLSLSQSGVLTATGNCHC